MPTYRLVDGDGAQLATFEAEDDAAGSAHGRQVARRRPAIRVFSVQREHQNSWTDVALWVTRPLFSE